MSFDDAGAAADQEFSLVRDTDGSVQYKTKVEKGNYQLPQIFFSGGHFLLGAPPHSPFSNKFRGGQHQDILYRASRRVHTGENDRKVS